MQVSVIIIAKNEESNIGRCLESVVWAQEVVLVDSGSTDATLQIAARFTNTKVVQAEWMGYSENKSLAVSHSSHNWILWVDADEEVTTGLQREILSLPESAPKVAYEIERQNHFMGQRVKYSGWGNEYIVRLFHKQHCYFDGSKVHEKVVINGAKGKLKNKLVHYTYRDLHTFMRKFDYYATQFALEKKGKKVTSFHLVVKPLVRFIKHYFVQKGFLDGRVGLVISVLSLYSVFLKYLKLWRINQGENLQ